MSFDLMVGGSGAFGNTRPRTKKRTAKSVETWPALAFVFPYHEMAMQDLLKVDGLYNVKTRRSNWNYRGPVLLYTSKGRYHHVPAMAYGLNPHNFPRGVIVGVANVVDSRLLTQNERLQMLCNFNKITLAQAEKISSWTDEYIEPLPFGVFLGGIKRFKKPVPYKPKPGAIGIMRVPVKLVAKALKEVGINPKSL